MVRRSKDTEQQADPDPAAPDETPIEDQAETAPANPDAKPTAHQAIHIG
ncbi:hypothetical protein IU433_12290 [Nocardia puris]|nr:hypothetical protein [Nocardia puris]MBF6459816.1 hypothetical protein [Nocardia puris]